MRVVGYDRAFRDAVLHELAPGLQIRVIPLPILALLKVVGYMDHPALRQKDLGDLLMIIDRYEENTDRRFSDDVLEAGVEYDEAGAFLLGQDLRLLCVAPDAWLRGARRRGVNLLTAYGESRLSCDVDCDVTPRKDACELTFTPIHVGWRVGCNSLIGRIFIAVGRCPLSHCC